MDSQFPAICRLRPKQASNNRLLRPHAKRSEKSQSRLNWKISTDIKHPELYANLKHWRYEVATEKGLPTYTILQQKALIGVANTLPASGRDLLKIPGIGKKIVENYGAKLLEIVDEYRKGQ